MTAVSRLIVVRHAELDGAVRTTFTIATIEDNSTVWLENLRNRLRSSNTNACGTKNVCVDQGKVDCETHLFSP